jgi:DNA mismatch repair protein MSH5
VSSPGGGESGNTSGLDDLQNDITMALELKTSGSLGCAYYSYEENSLYLLEDTFAADLDTVEQLLIHCQPTTLLLPMRSPERLQLYVKHLSGDNDEVAEGWFSTSGRLFFLLG